MDIRGKTLKEILELPDGNLLELLNREFRVDSKAKGLPISIFWDELRSRKQEKINRSIRSYTIVIMVMTVIMTISTIVNVVLFLRLN